MVLNIKKSKTKVLLTTLILVFTFAVSMIAILPIALGQIQIASYSYAYATPNPVGVNQPLYIVGWVNPPPATSGAVYSNYTFIITRPDGTTDTQYFNTSNVEATRSFTYVCTQTGNWAVKLVWPGDSKHYATTSLPYTWTVQQNYTAPSQSNQPLPNGQWSFPISGEYREWYQIAGPWYETWYDASGSFFNAYTKAPITPHVLYKFEIMAGGLFGGESGWLSQPKPDDTRGTFPAGGLVAADGRIYYVTTLATGSNVTAQHPVLHCIDQTTGKAIYTVDIPCDPKYPYSPGRVLGLDISGLIKGGALPGVAGQVEQDVFSLWIVGNGIWEIDAWNGNVLYYQPGVNGLYSYNGENEHAAIYMPNYPSPGNLSKFDCNAHQVVWTNNAGSISYVSNGILVKFYSSTGGYPLGLRIATWNATDGSLIANGTDLGFFSSEGASRIMAAYGMTYIHADDMRVHAISLTTAKEVWQSEQWDTPWGAFAAYSESLGYGFVYFRSWDGYLRCYNATTGALVWKDYSADSTDMATGHYVWWGDCIVADGKLYLATGEHTSPNPPARGNSLYCIDAFNGTVYWKLDDFMGRSDLQHGGISAGMLWYLNDYDSCEYMFGMGATKTTVSAPQTVVPLGTDVLIQGTVTDQSPGAPDTPAVSDASQATWVQYLYMNAPKPTNATGVLVSLVAISSDSTVTNIGSAISDTSGQYSILWTPAKAGIYKIVASFGGSGSYYSSSGETSAAISKAPSTLPQATATPTPTATASPIVTPTIAPTPAPTTPQGPAGIPASTMYAISAAIVIIVVVVVAAVVLRRRK